MVSTGSGFWGAVLVCVVPFAPGDVIKAVIAEGVVLRFRKSELL
jgi:biotin transporter BioY